MLLLAGALSGWPQSSFDNSGRARPRSAPAALPRQAGEEESQEPQEASLGSRWFDAGQQAQGLGRRRGGLASAQRARSDAQARTALAQEEEDWEREVDERERELRASAAERAQQWMRRLPEQAARFPPLPYDTGQRWQPRPGRQTVRVAQSDDAPWEGTEAGGDLAQVHFVAPRRQRNSRRDAQPAQPQQEGPSARRRRAAPPDEEAPPIAQGGNDGWEALTEAWREGWD
jgi:hypothetical protein